MKGGSELKVGIFTAVAIAVAVYASMATTDNPFADKGYVLHARLYSAEGLNDGSAVELAGVRIGAVSDIVIREGMAIADLSMDPGYQLPIDSTVKVASRGILGDTVLKVRAGTADLTLQDDDWIEAEQPVPGLSEIQGQLSEIATDIQAITGSLRAMIDNEETVGRVDAILTNVETFTEEITTITRTNREGIGDVVENIRLLTEQLNDIAEGLTPQIDEEMEAIADVTQTLNRGLQRVESIAAKIDEGEGTIGKLVTDSTLVDEISGTVEDIGGIVRSVNRFQLEVYYRGEVHFSPLRSERRFGTKNLIGVRVKPRPDYWYVFEFVDDPLGDFSEEIVFLNTTTNGVREVRRTDNLQLTLQFAKRFRDLVLRLGIKENTGGVGADLMLWDDRIMLSLDVFDFTYASWPSDFGAPNVKFAVDVSPLPHVYFTAGVDNLVNGIIKREPTWFVGGGVVFTDNDLRWILPNLPAGAL